MNKIYGPSRRDETGVSDDNLMEKIVEPFVDDTVTKSEREGDHINDLGKVLSRLVANNITLKMEKGVWGTEQLPLLENRRWGCVRPRECSCLGGYGAKAGQ